MLRFSGAGISDVGRVRPENEDSAFVGPYVAVVADGVGGAAAGEVASATATYAMAATALARFGDVPEVVLTAGAEAAQASVQRGVQTDLRRLGMATTLTAVVCDGDRVVLGHVGDSRAYLLRDGRATQVSRDHTYVQRLVDHGEIDAVSAAVHPWRNVVLRSVDGDPVHPAVDLVPLDVVPGDRLLLCSDGLTDLVPDEAIAGLLGGGEPEEAASALVDAALGAGGRDNVTCVVLDVVDGPRVVGDGQLLGAVREIANVVDPAAVRGR
ncbi:PP2C family protein-serine/threonine phosphatase [Nocardioides sp.]|uniref:PP2C family protein-serine/threonine phosphatase n=1 Tax=Nocardioides sp. TaxID=35761 RepID=UPI0037836750